MQTTNPDDFHKQTDTFSLTVALTDNKLTITLKDFVDWVIYSKQYTKEQIGGEIHQKMDLFDVYNSFSQTKPQCDEQNMKGKYMVSKIQRLESWINQIKQGKTEQMESIKRQLSLKYDQMLQIQNLKIQSQNRQQTHKLLQLAEKMQFQTQRSSNNLNQREYYHYQSSDKFAGLEPEPKIIKKQKLKPLIYSLQQKHSDCFNVDGLKVQLISSGEDWTHYIFCLPIFHDKQATFRIRVTQTQNRYIMVGVVDYARQKDQRLSYNSENAMCYDGYNGRKYPSAVIEGDGFKQGDVVEVSVNRTTNTVKYIVNGVLQATETNNMLSDSSRVFMPYVEMYNRYDTIEWLM